MAGAELLQALRGAGRPRPAPVPGLDRRLREILEAGIGEELASLPAGVVVRATKGTLEEVGRCEAGMVARLAARATMPASAEMVAGSLLDRVFALVVIGRPAADPVGAALEMADAEADTGLLASWSSLVPEERALATQLVTEMAGSLAAHWPALPHQALPRLQEPLRVSLGGGRVLLTGRVDLLLGRPAAERAGVTLIDTKSGHPRHQDRADAWWYAVLETLRHRVPPFQVGSYYLRTGWLDLATVEADHLLAAAEDIARALLQLVRLAAGALPQLSPNPLCGWCPALPGCAPGRAYSLERGDYLPPRDDDDDDGADDGDDDGR